MLGRILIIFLLIPTTALAEAKNGPFGIWKGASVEEIRKISTGEARHNNYVWLPVNPPFPHSLLTEYTVEASDRDGACGIIAQNREGVGREQAILLLREIESWYGDYDTANEELGWTDFGWKLLGREDQVETVNYRLSSDTEENATELHLYIRFEGASGCFSDSVEGGS